jgi:DNA repair photolyase
MERFISYFKCGKVRKDSRYLVLYFTVSNLTDNIEKIIPFFQEHRILGVKYLDFEDWCKAAEIIRTKSHLSVEGLDKLRKIQSNMNSRRSLSQS